MSSSSLAGLLQPYIFSPLITVGFGLALLLYLLGLRTSRRQGRRTGVLQSLSFLSGLVLFYAVMHTAFDYYAQYMFFMHRLQHLVLHHLGPFLIALAAPWPVLAAGLPEWLRRQLRPLWNHPAIRNIYRFLQHPLIAPLLFVGLIFFWLTPAIHFDAMLNLTLYHVMNWSMLLDGLLFWWLMLDPREPAPEQTLAFGKRILILFLIMLPQIALGAIITLSHSEIYDVYAVCGRAWPLDAQTDQQLGGLITWIPAAMMSVMGSVIVLRFMLRDDSRTASAPVKPASVTLP
jgi:putative membrane protein